MKILIIGGTGFISSYLTEKLLAEGHNITLLTRGRSNTNYNSLINYVTGDRADERILRELAFENFDAVYDMIAYTQKESETAAIVFKNKIGRFIHCSTISVYMISNDTQAPITEDQWNLPLMHYWEKNPFGMDYGINKRECEEVLWKYHDEKIFPVSMIRPTFVSGPGDPAKRDLFWIERILDGKPVLIPGSGNFAFQNVFVEDVAAAFVNLLKYDISIGEAYNVAAEEIFSMKDYLKVLFKLLNTESDIITVDQSIFKEQDFSSSPYMDLFPYNVQRTSIFSLAKIKRDLNYQSTPFTIWMNETIQWYTKEYPAKSKSYSRREDELNFISILKQKTLSDI